MIIHKNCRSAVAMNSIGYLAVVSTFTLTQRGVKPGMGKIKQLEENSSPKFFCPECQKDIPDNEVAVICDRCGEEHKAAEIFKYEEISGEYCLPCLRIFYPDVNVRNFVKIEAILTKLDI